MWVFRFSDPGPGASGGPRKVPLGYLWAFPGPPEASRKPPGPKTNQSKNPRNLKNKLSNGVKCVADRTSGRVGYGMGKRSRKGHLFG